MKTFLRCIYQSLAIKALEFALAIAGGLTERKSLGRVLSCGSYLIVVEGDVSEIAKRIDNDSLMFNAS